MLNIKEFRKQNNITQEELANYLGVSKSFISQVEHGARELPRTQLSKLLNNEEGWDSSAINNGGDTSPRAAGFLAGGDGAVLLERIKGLERLLEQKERLLEEKERMIRYLLEAKSVDSSLNCHSEEER